MLVVLPLFHVYALNGTLAAVARSAATAVLLDRFDPSGHAGRGAPRGRHQHPGRAADVRRLVADTRAWPRRSPAYGCCSPARRRCRRRCWSRSAPRPGCRSSRGTGSPRRRPASPRRWWAAAPSPARSAARCPGVEVRLVDEEGELAEDGDPGEIQVRGPNLFSGYWPDGSGGPDEEGWYATGDVAYEDDDGDLVLVDRRKELVIVSGFNVYPREVEDVLATHPDVAEVAVVGVPHPYTGEAVKAYVVPRPGSHLTPSDVTAYVGDPAGAVQVADDHRARRRAAALGHRQGRQGPAARAAGVSEP